MQLASSTWDAAERDALLRVIDSGQYTMGAKVLEAEKAYADFCGSKYCVMVNSGSSANLLMVAAYTLRHKAGTVAVPALGWSTSYAPFQQYGWHLRFGDIDRDTLQYGPNIPTADLTLAVNILGSCNRFDGISGPVLEDNCESMGAEYHGKKAGTFGVMGSHSTFFSHHICTMEGGFVTTDDEYFYHMLLSLRSHGWTRHLPKKNLLSAKVEAFNFILPGYNVRPLEMCGAVAVEQIKKLPKILWCRRLNADRFPLKKQKEIGRSSWMGFVLLSDDIGSLKKQLEERGIEHRPVVSGNFLRHSAIRYFKFDSQALPNADYVHDNGLMVGNYGSLVDWKSFDAIVV